MTTSAFLSMSASLISFAGSGSGLRSLLSSLELLVSLGFCISVIVMLLTMRKHWKQSVESKLNPATTNATTRYADTLRKFPTLNALYVSWLPKFKPNFQRLSPLTSRSGPAVKSSFFTRRAPAFPETELHREIRVAGNWRRVKLLAMLLAAFSLGYFVKAYRDQGLYPGVEEWRHVKVIQQLDRTTWNMRGHPVRYGKEQAEDDLRFTCCPDFPCETVIHPLWKMDHFLFEERGWCKSILAPGLGSFYDFDSSNRVMKIDDRGNELGYVP